MGEGGGEEMSAWREVMEGEKRFVDQASQKEAVRKLTDLLKDYSNDYTGVGSQLSNNLVELDSRMSVLANDMNGYMHLVDAWRTEQGKFDPEGVRIHIAGIKTMLTTHGRDQATILDQVSQVAKDLKAAHGPGAGKDKIASATNQSKAVEEFAAKGSRQTDLLLVVIVTVVVGFGILFFNRMRYYEKKHVI